MSNWSSTQLTDLGRALDAKVTAGTTLLSFTKMKLGSGTETAEDIPAMTDLVSPKLVLGISSCAVSASDDTVCELISVASSSDVEDSFVVRELGVFATDPDVGEILYAVMLDSTPDTMPNENVSSPVTVTYQVNIVSDNASSITAVIDPAGLVNVAALDAAIREHDTAPDAHDGVLLTRKQVPAFNHRDVITTSGTYTAPVDGWYHITCIGGGGAGGNAGGGPGVGGNGGLSGTQGGTTSFGSYCSAAGGHSGGGGGSYAGGGGGASGEIATTVIFLNVSDSVTCTIGAGGVATTSGGSVSTVGQDGSGGAKGGAAYTGGQGAISPYGSGNTGSVYVSASYYGSAGPTGIGGTNGTPFGGGGGGGVTSHTSSVPQYAPSGGGNGSAGATITASDSTYTKGGDGGDGAIIIEYFDE